MKGKKSLLVFVAAAIMLFMPQAHAQNKTFKFLDELQLTYPSNCTIHAIEKEYDLYTGESCSFIISAVFSDGSEERMKVMAESKAALSLLSLATDAPDNEILESMAELMLSMIGASPVYSSIKEGDKGGTNKYAYSGFFGNCR